MLASKQRRVSFTAALALVTFALVAFAFVALRSGASQRLVSTATAPSPPSIEPPPLAAPKAGRAPPEVHTLYQHATSAYHARLFADEDAVVLITQTGFTTLRTGEAPEEHTVELGPVATRQGGSVFFWRSGMLRERSLSGESERSLAATPRAPQYLLASEGHLAWIDTDRKTGASLHTTSLRTPSAGDVRAIHHSDDSVSAAVMRRDVVYWVLQARDGSWRIGRAGLDGQHRTTPAHQGRPPSALALGPDGIYFYAGPERGVRRSSFDLDREEPVLPHVVCSPLVVSSRVVCAQVGGLFDIPRAGAPPRFLASEQAGPITTTAATDDRAFWVAESGSGLVVRAASLAGL